MSVTVGAVSGMSKTAQGANAPWEVWVPHAVRGGAALVLGIGLLLPATADFAALPYLLTIYGLASGGVLIASATVRGSEAAAWRLLSGLAYLASATSPWLMPVAAVEPGLVAAAGAAALAGAVDVGVAHGRRDAPQEPLLAFAGAVLIAVGIVMLVAGDIPLARQLTVIAVFFALAGLLFAAQALRRRGGSAPAVGRRAPEAVSPEQVG